MKIPDQVAKVAAKQLLVLKKQAPHILFGAGIAGIVTSTVLACRATLKVGDKLDEIKVNVDGVKRDALQPYLSHRHSTNKAPDNRRQLAAVYAKGSLDISMLYAPAILIGSASLAALLGSHVTLARRNSALTAAYMTISKAFQDYRDRVREELGEEKEQQLYRKSQVDVVKNPDGSETVVSKQDHESYARVYDERNRNWQPNAEENYLFLKANQAAWNVYLRVHKHVMLNDVYKSLGFEPSKAGQLVGWVYGGDGDNYIDFGLSDPPLADYAINGDRNFQLDFNVDGIVYHLI
jgi:hypothetical protein